MRPSVLVVFLAAAVMATATPRLARAQPAPELTTGWTVHVTTANGRTEKGVVIDIREMTLNIIIRDRPTSIPLADVRQIDRETRDPVRDGLWTGVFAGATAGALIAVVAQPCYVTRCTGLNSRAIAMGFGAGSGALLGGIAGVIADYAYHARVQVYPKPAAAHPLVIVPIVSARAVGAGALIRW